MNGKKEDQIYDVFIVGGGPVGLTLASALVMSMPDLDVGMADLRKFEVPNDERSFALAAGVARIYQAMGIWEEMTERSSAIEHMRITDSGTTDISRPLFLSFDGDVAPGQPYAHMVPNADLTRAVMNTAKDRVTYFGEENLVSLQQEPHYALLTFESGKTIKSRLVVGADGGRSKVRALLGISTYDYDYKQSGLVATIRHELPHNQTAYEHFRPQGPFASLPLAGQRSSLVWTAQSDKVADILALTKAEQEEMIGAETGWSLGQVELDSKIQAFPLSLRLARDIVADRAALVGDAAHVVHPIAGQGLNLGLQDVACLAETIINAIRLGLDHGQKEQLIPYEQARRFETALMAASTDSLNRLFSNDIDGLRALRDFGLSVVDRMTPVKNRLIQHAAAAHQKGPKLMQGRLI